MTNKFYIKSKAKTFYKGDEFSEALSWFVKHIETHDWQPEGTNWIGGEPVPPDPRCDLAKKYVITIKEVR